MRENVVYNYNVVRFLPYPETGEFVNIGVVLFCPQLGFFDFRLETGRTKRVTGFFPELERSLLRSALVAFRAEAEHFKKLFCENRTRVFGFEAKVGMEYYASFTRPREGLIRFSNVRTELISDDATPEATLGKLFADVVERQFAQEREYREYVMKKRLASDLCRANLAAYYKPGTVGNEEYHVGFPFVYRREERAVKVLKPLNLNKPDSTGIYDHGDEWVLRLTRLDKLGLAPDQVLITVDHPDLTDDRRTKAAAEVCQQLQKIPNLVVIDFADTNRILQTARVD